MVTVYQQGSDNEARALALARDLELPLSTQLPAQGLVLHVQHPLALSFASRPRSRVCVDFLSAQVAYRRLRGGGIKQALTRAVGLHRKRDLRIVDATGGLAKDAFVLATYATEVTILEQSAILHCMIDEAIQSARLHGDTRKIADRMHAIHTNSVVYFQNQTSIREQDVIYIDPMYPPRVKSAAVRMDMQILQQLVHTTIPAESLLQNALNTGVKRIVLKRPGWATPVLQQYKTGEVNTGNTRFDIYTGA